VVTGIKQSGVQVFVFVGGLVVPSLAVSFGRTTTYMVLAAVAVVVGVVAALTLPNVSSSDNTRHGEERGPSTVPRDIWWIAVYGFLLGFAGSSAFLYVLFTEEQLGQTIIVAGLVAAVAGLVAIPSRILWARHAERTANFRVPLIIIALISVATAGTLMIAESGAWWFVWVGSLRSSRPWVRRHGTRLGCSAS
jgi:MFS family permease